MHITVLHVISENLGSPWVSFECALGRGSAQWFGQAPCDGLDYDVEIDVPGILEWQSEIFESSGPARMSDENGEFSIVGQFITLDESGVASIRLDNDIILVQTNRMPEKIPDFLAIRLSNLMLYEIHL